MDKRTKGQKSKRPKGKKEKRTKGPRDKRTKLQKDKIILKKIFEVLWFILGMCTFLLHNFNHVSSHMSCVNFFLFYKLMQLVGGWFVLPVLIMYAEKFDYTDLLRTKEKGTIEANEDYGHYGEDYMETEFK